MIKDDCIFCKLANGIIPTNTIYEDDYFTVILDNGPVSKGHALVIPKEHFDDLFSLDDEYAAKLMVVAKKVSIAMKEELSFDGFNLLQNNGTCAGQSIFHFHLHLIPRYIGDNINLVPKSIEMNDEFFKDFSTRMKKRF